MPVLHFALLDVKYLPVTWHWAVTQSLRSLSKKLACVIGYNAPRHYCGNMPEIPNDCRFQDCKKLGESYREAGPQTSAHLNVDRDAPVHQLLCILGSQSHSCFALACLLGHTCKYTLWVPMVSCTERKERKPVTYQENQFGFVMNSNILGGRRALHSQGSIQGHRNDHQPWLAVTVDTKLNPTAQNRGHS